jgi:hypothetical protein
MGKYSNGMSVDIYSITGAIDALVRAYAVSDEEVREVIKVKLVELIKEL